MLDRPTSPAPRQPVADDFAQAVIEGLSKPQKSLPCRFFYDAAGSALFEEITALPEYYPTRTETKILAACAAEIAATTPAGSVLVEFGSGSSRKTEILLAALPALAAYVPIDVSPDALDEAADRLTRRFPGLDIFAQEGDFLCEIDMPGDLAERPRLGFFPGSTIGNFSPDEACDLLRGMARSLGPGSRLIVGVDLRKDTATLVSAYDDAAGVTARFNLNLLVRANRELGTNFEIGAFRHEAVFNEVESRIEMHLVSCRAQTVEIAGHRFALAAGERIHTENSYKYAVPKFQALAAQAGWRAARVWVDADQLFSVHELARSERDS